MAFIGEQLKKTRIDQGLGLNTISRELNISEHYLISIENNEIDKNLNIVFIIGHIRSYAKFLNLDDNLIIKDFKNQISYNNLNQNKVISKPIENSNFLNFYRPLSFLFVFVIAFSFYFLFVKPNNQNINFAMTPDVPENMQGIIEKIDTDLVLSKKNKIKDNIETFKFIDDEDISFSSVKASLPNEKNNSIVSNQISLKFINPTWVQIRDENDNIIISRLMDQGDEYFYSISDNYNLTAGNAGNILVSINNIIKGKAGRPGEVLDSLSINNNFNN